MSQGPPKQQFTYPYPRPALTADLILISREARPRVLLIRRKHDPFAGVWALPGGFVEENEPLETAARRELKEEAGLDAAELEQLHTFGDPGRDPRGWTVSVAFIGRVDPETVRPRAGDDAAEVGWHPLDALPPLAFDHEKILAVARQWLTGQKRTTSI
ncbi:MAG TPA: NUDIX hydrolase [Gemmataceae bacterium]|nr:NUDIX hydrolase [Gemmataceae bacterium]